MRQRIAEVVRSVPRISSWAVVGTAVVGLLAPTAPARAATPQSAGTGAPQSASERPSGDSGATRTGQAGAETPRPLTLDLFDVGLTDDAAASRAAQQQRRGSGFRFGRPAGWVGVRGGWNLARAESDIFAFNSETLTLEGKDFNAPFIGLDVGWTITDRVDAVFGVEYSKVSPRSEFRDFVDEFGAPIVQETALQQAPLTVSLRLNLLPRGRSVGSFAWVPATVTPYVGGGAGIVWWKYEQFGDFVDFVDLTIFTEHFASDGVSPTAHVFGGLEFSVSPRFGLALEGRYAWADGELAPAFVGFEPIDLNGFRGSFGVMFRF